MVVDLKEIEKKEELFKLGEEVGLNDQHLYAFVCFFNKRFPHHASNHYAKEWAIRFLKGIHIQKADLESERVIIEAYKFG